MFALTLVETAEKDPKAIFVIGPTMSAWDFSPAASRVLQDKIDRSSPDYFESSDIIEAGAAHQAMASRTDLPSGEFNTERPYTVDGQIIRWRVIDEEITDAGEFWEARYLTVDFDDISRNIRGRVLCLGEVTQRAIMEQYDKGRYQNV